MTAPQTASRLVLIVDDDADLSAALVKVLQREGYRVRWAVDGSRGVQMAREERPDLILLDYMMPVQTGFAACRELGKLPGLNAVPIIILTAFGQDIGEIYGLGEEDRRKVNIQGFLEKPVEINVLLERVAEALGPA